MAYNSDALRRARYGRKQLLFQELLTPVFIALQALFIPELVATQKRLRM
jgi:hypothetical protein